MSETTASYVDFKATQYAEYSVLVDAQGCESTNYTPASDTVDLFAPPPP